MDFDLVDVDEEECQPVFPVRPGAKQPYPVSGSASTGGSSGRGDTAGPPEKSFDYESAVRERSKQPQSLDVGVRVYASIYTGLNAIRRGP